MTSMSSSLNLSNAPVVCGRALPPAKLRLPEFSTVYAWLNCSNKHKPLGYKINRKQISKVTECRGVLYIKENVHKLKDGNIEHMTSGFEIVVPAIIERAKALGIQGLPYDDPIIKEIYSTKERRLSKIPKDLIYKLPTTLLFSLEGLGDLDWEKILELQSGDGSFLTSPSSTAFVFMQTKDEKCYKFIENAVRNCNGGAPHTYPVDVFARLQRLGISRFFHPEIKYFLDHINNVWTENGVFSGRDSQFCDIDDTSMGIRLLKMHGYDVDPRGWEILMLRWSNDRVCISNIQSLQGCSTPIPRRRNS